MLVKFEACFANEVLQVFDVIKGYCKIVRLEEKFLLEKFFLWLVIRVNNVHNLFPILP